MSTFESPVGPGEEPRVDQSLPKLYRLRGIGIATFLGSPIAGGILLAVNARRMGSPGLATQALLVCVSLTLGLFALSFVYEEFPDNSLVAVVERLTALIGVLAVVAYAKGVQLDRISDHIAQGGGVESNWKAAGIGLVCAIGILMVVMVAAYVMELIGLPI